MARALAIQGVSNTLWISTCQWAHRCTLPDLVSSQEQRTRIPKAAGRITAVSNCGQYANFVVILHSDGTTGEYYHLAEGGALVEVGDNVVRGQAIALSGNTGHTTMPHLHFAVYRAIDWGRTQSIAVRFDSTDGIIDRPRRGARYVAL
jgi:murein DD-endopeptidase MepM/ murein hydrolase activator NlpD